jgi:hypothetical protein
MACESTVIIVSNRHTSLYNGKQHTRLHGRKHGRNTCKLGVEIARIRWACNLWGKRRLHPLVVNIIPVDVPEERMGHDFLSVGRSRSQSHLRLTSEQLLEDGNRIAGHVDGVERLIGENGVVNFVFVFTAEGRLLEEHLVDEDTECPPVDGAAVLLVQENLEESVSEIAMTDFNRNLPLAP